MTPNIRVALEKLNYKQHNDIYKVGFEWCEKYGLNEPDRVREKSRFLDGMMLGSYLTNQTLQWVCETEQPPMGSYVQLWMANDLNLYSVVVGRKAWRDNGPVLLAGFRNPTGLGVDIELDASVYTYWADLPERPSTASLNLPEYPYPHE
jgi:hypothetical protein